jgi:hypothetical protein
MENTREGQRMTKLTWAEAVKRYLKDWSVPRKLAVDRTA